MEKIWIVKAKRSSARKFTIYKSESELLKNIVSSENFEVFEYTLESKITTKDYLIQRERDLQIRTVLNELNEDEVIINEFIRTYERLAPEGKKYKTYYGEERTKKSDWIDELKKCNSKKDLAKKIIADKKYFITLSTDVDWYVSVLKIHNFRDHKYKNRYYSSKERKFITKEIPEEIENNFRKAKLKIKNEKGN